MTVRAAWIGLGVMGFPMAGHLVTRGGVEVTVYNRTATKAEKWLKSYKGKAAASPEEASKDATIRNDDRDRTRDQNPAKPRPKTPPGRRR